MPANEVWVVEYIMLWAPTGAVMSHQLWDGPNNIGKVGYPAPATAGTDPIPLWGQMSSQAASNPYNTSFRIKPSTDVYYSILAGAAGATGSIRVQVKRIKLKDRPRRVTSTGMAQPKVNAETVETTETGRHTGTWQPARA